MNTTTDPLKYGTTLVITSRARARVKSETRQPNHRNAVSQHSDMKELIPQGNVGK